MKYFEPIPSIVSYNPGPGYLDTRLASGSLNKKSVINLLWYNFWGMRSLVALNRLELFLFAVSSFSIWLVLGFSRRY